MERDPTCRGTFSLSLRFASWFRIALNPKAAAAKAGPVRKQGGHFCRVLERHVVVREQNLEVTIEREERVQKILLGEKPAALRHPGFSIVPGKKNIMEVNNDPSIQPR